MKSLLSTFLLVSVLLLTGCGEKGDGALSEQTDVTAPIEINKDAD